MQQSEIIIFYSYFPDDGDLREKLDQHLSLCIRERDQPIKRLHRGNIGAGKPVQLEIDQAIDTANLILLLVSPDFLADSECQRQVKRAMDRQERSGTSIIPIILHYCNWRDTRFGGLQCLPRTGSPVGGLDGPSLNKALTDIAEELRKVIVGISSHISTPPMRGRSYKGPDKDGYAFAVDIGRSHVTCCLAKMDAEIIDSHVNAPLDTALAGGEKTLESVAESLSELADKNRISWELVQGIAISVPGVLRGNYLISPLMMGRWFKLNIPDTLRKNLPKTQEQLHVYLENDANMGAFGESRRDVRGKHIPNLIYVKVGTGIGAGLILRGQLYRGHNGAAGEFGHIRLESEIRGLAWCASCEKQGCLESLAGEGAIIKEVYKIRQREGGEPSDNMTILEVVEAARRGDRACREALENAGERIGRAIGSCLINIYNPSHIMLDGSVIRADAKGEHLLYNTLCRSAVLSSLSIAMQDTKIDIAHLGDKAVVHGAIMTVIEKSLRDRKSTHF